MDNNNKKILSVINAEEQHLASMSTTTVKRTVKKTTKSKLKLKEKVLSTEQQQQNTDNVEDSVEKSSPSPSSTIKMEMMELSTAAETKQKSDEDVNDKIFTKPKKTKSKKKRSQDFDTQNISVKSSFSKFDALQKRNLIHVRSSDSGKAHEKFSNPEDMEKQTNCRLCQKPVYKMEEIKAEKSVYHKNCFRCQECSKQLKVDNYQSHVGTLYCLVHFKLLFAPKVVEDTEPQKPRKAELIIRESQPAELPPDVVRASDKPDLGLEELQQLNVRSRFQVFENAALNQQKKEENESDVVKKAVEVKRSKSILSKLARLQQNGFGQSITAADLMGHEVSESDTDTQSDNNNNSNSEDEDDESERVKLELERPIGLGEEAIKDIKSKFEKGHMLSKDERREERKQEIQNIRSRLFLGKQAKIKELYQQAVADSEQGVTSVGKKPDVEIGTTAQSIKERFEKGEMFKSNSNECNEGNNSSGGLTDDIDVFESAISKQSRNIFMELDANIASGKSTTDDNKTALISKKNVATKLKNYASQNEENLDSISSDVVKSDEIPEDVKITTSEISQKFKFFETYRAKECEKPKFRMTPPRDGVVKMPSPEQECDSDADLDEAKYFTDNILQKTQTTSKMLNKFREMEQNKTSNINAERGPRPLKCFTPPPPDGLRRQQSGESDEDDELSEDNETEDEDEELEQQQWKSATNDEALKEAQAQARAKQLRAKFEKWQANEIQREINEGHVDIYSQHVSDDSTIESTKTIRDRFENLKNIERKTPTTGVRQVNRFV